MHEHLVTFATAVSVSSFSRSPVVGLRTHTAKTLQSSKEPSIVQRAFSHLTTHLDYLRMLKHLSRSHCQPFVSLRDVWCMLRDVYRTQGRRAFESDTSRTSMGESRSDEASCLDELGKLVHARQP